MVAIAKSAWAVPTYCHDLGFEMCNVLRESSGLMHLIGLCKPPDQDSNDRHLHEKATFEAARLIEQSLSPENRAYIVEHGLDVVSTNKHRNFPFDVNIINVQLCIQQCSSMVFTEYRGKSN